MDRSPASRARIDFALLLLCFLASGAAGLIYQTAWTQQFTLVFGASELAVVAVLAGPELVNKALRVLDALPVDPGDERRELLRIQLSELPRTVDEG